MNGFGQDASRGRFHSTLHLLLRHLRSPAHRPARDAFSHPAHALFCKAVRQLDAWLRNVQQIEEFTDEGECVFRVSLHEAPREVVLSDNTRALPGDLMGEIHLWNEHMAPVPPEGAGMSWGILMRRRAHRSLILLARRVMTDPRFEKVKVFRGRTAFGTGKPSGQVLRIARGLGFDVMSVPMSRGLVAWCVAWGESIYLWAMTRTFCPGLAKSNRLVRPRWHELWMSRNALLERYGTSNPTTEERQPG